MSFAERLVKLQSFSHCLFRIDRPGEVVVTIPQCGLGQSVLRIFSDGLLVVFDSFLHAVYGQLVEIVATLQIKLIRLGVFSVTSGQLLFLCIRQLQAQLLCNLVSDRFLYRDSVFMFSNVLCAPDMGVVARIGQLNTDGNQIVMPGEAARQNGLYLQFFTYDGRIGFASFITKRRIARHDFELRQLGQAMDKSLRDTLAEVLKTRIVRYVSERQDGYRID